MGEHRHTKYYFDLLNFLRFFLCLWLLLYHYDGITGWSLMPFHGNWYLGTFISTGRVALECFFIISGFCIGAKYRKPIVEHKERFVPFVMHHYGKLLILTLLTLPLSIYKQYLMELAGLEPGPTWMEAVLDGLNIRLGYGFSNTFPFNSPLWFINVLMICYVLYYLLVHSLYAKHRIWYVGCSMIIWFLGMARLIGAGYGDLFIYNGFTAVGCSNFFLGVLLFDLYEYGRSQKKLQIKIHGCALLALIGIILYDLYASYALVHGSTINYWGSQSVVLSVFLWTPFVWFSAVGSEVLGEASLGILSQKVKDGIHQVGKHLGRFSTSLYAWHYVIFYVLLGWKTIIMEDASTLVLHGMPLGIAHMIFNMELSAFTTLAQVFLVVCVVAFVSCYGLEPLLQKLGTRLFRKIQNGGALWKKQPTA